MSDIRLDGKGLELLATVCRGSVDRLTSQAVTERAGDYEKLASLLSAVANLASFGSSIYAAFATVEPGQQVDVLADPVQILDAIVAIDAYMLNDEAVKAAPSQEMFVDVVHLRHNLHEALGDLGDHVPQSPLPLPPSVTGAAE